VFFGHGIKRGVLGALEAVHEELGDIFRLPLEQFLFFALASALVTFGIVLGVAVESRARLLAICRSASHHQATV
jgi:hypothetical protein